MTRTERAAYPRAVVKDRSEPKNLMNKRIPKHGAGPHNWGSLEDELDLELAAEQDEEQELVEEGVETNPARHEAHQFSANQAEYRRAGEAPRRGSAASVTEEERERARQARLHALERTDIDLNTIARTSAAVSTSPPTEIPTSNPQAPTATLRVE